MKKIRLNYLTIIVIAALLSSGCAGLTKMRDNATARYIPGKTQSACHAHAGEVKCNRRC